VKNIDLLSDVGAPAVVTALNIGTRASTMTMFGQNVSTWLPYLLTGGGYLAAYMGWGGQYNPFLKNVAIAAAPLAFEKLYNQVKGIESRVSRPMMNRVSRYPAPAEQSPFGGVRLV
jgi:hypothetical protein